MNSDPLENAAWRTFGMLDADEASSFDEATRLHPELKAACAEIDHLAAAIAVVSSQPVAPQAGQLEQLRQRLGINQPRRVNWFGISGWAAAAAITAVFLSQRTPTSAEIYAQATPPGPVATKPQVTVAKQVTVVAAAGQAHSEQAPQVTKSSQTTRLLTRVEPRQLTQKIELLQEEVEVLQRREQQRLEVRSDVAWPVVVRMRPVSIKSGKAPDIVLDSEPPSLTETLGDALAANQGGGTSNPDPVSPTGDEEITGPKVISIYDPATREGQVIASDLPAAGPGEELKLFADTRAGRIEVGTIPSTGEPSQTFNFATEPVLEILGMSVDSVKTAAGMPPVSTVILSSSPPPKPRPSP